MKNLVYILSLVGCMGLASSCQTDADFDYSLPENPVMSPLRGISGIDGDGATIVGTVDQTTKTAQISFNSLPDLTQVMMKIDVPQRAELVYPESDSLMMDLSQPVGIIVRANGEDITYTLNASLAEYREFSTANVKQFKLDNDAQKPWPDANIGFQYLFDGLWMETPADYGAINYLNFQFQANEASIAAGDNTAAITFDVGEEVYLRQVKTHAYWFNTMYQVTKYEVWGYCKEGEPAKDGNWDDWTKLGEFNYHQVPTVFAEGDDVIFDKETIQKARYYRIRCTENWRAAFEPTSPNLNVYAFAEIRLWVYNKR